MRNLTGVVLMLIRTAISGVVSCFCGVALAQEAMDPSSALLLSQPLGPPSVHAQRDQGVESGRYTVRPKSSAAGAGSIAAGRRTESLSGPVPSGPATVAGPVLVTPSSDGSVLIRDQAHPLAAAATGAAGGTLPLQDHVAPAAVGASPNGAGGVDRVDGFLSGLVRLSVGVAYYSESSASNYSYREYGISGPAYGAEARVWLTPQFGVGAAYVSSLAGQVGDRSGDVSVQRSDLVWGALLRQRFAESSLLFGIEAVESQFKVAGEALDRLSTRSKGYRLRLEGDFGEWAASVSLAPKLKHEESAAATSFQSGTGVESYAAGVFIERRWMFDRRNQLFVRFRHTVERNLFTGSATRSEPVSGQPPTGVGVTVGTSLVEFGYHWSN